MNEFLDLLAEQLGEPTGSLEPLSRLEDFSEWDSLGTLTVVSVIREKYGVTILSEEIAAVETAGDLWELVDRKRAAGGGAS